MKRWLRIRQLAWGFGRRTKSEAGYTITEVMIVLAVTSVMFVVIVLLFSGRQAGVEFSQAVRDYEATLQNTMNEVSSGYYESNFRCSTLSGSVQISNIQAADAGTNQDCMFLGKIIIPNAGVSSSEVDTLVGRRLLNGQDVRTLVEAQPIVADGVRKSINHSFGLRVREIQNLDGNNLLHGLGFLNPITGGSSMLGGSVGIDRTGGEGLIRLYGLSTPGFNAAANLVELREGAVICVEGQNGKFAEITIGADGSRVGINSVLNTAEEGEACDGL